MTEKSILIIGYGNIGKHIKKEFICNKDISISEYDVKGYFDLPLDASKPIYKDITRSLMESTHFDFAFVCVPTERKEDGSCDTSKVYSAIEQWHKFVDTFIIKSAIPVGTCRDLAYLYPNNFIVCSPEYYGTTQHSEESPNFAIIGTMEGVDRIAKQRVTELYQLVKNGYFKFIYTDFETAELAKYMENCWIATKVTFCNEFAKAAEKFDVDYNELRECFVADSRVSPSHTFVYSEQPYYDSHCLNKDIPAFITQCEKEINWTPPLMKEVATINYFNKKKTYYKSLFKK